MDMFIVKKIAAMLIMPLPAIIALMLLSWIFWWRNKKRVAIACQLASCLLLILVSTPWLPNHVLRDLEQQYHQFDMSTPVNTVVVLGCGHAYDGALPLSAQIKPCSLYRLVEGIRLLKANPDSILITSGQHTQPYTHAQMLKRLAVDMGVAPERIRLQNNSKDTEEEVLALKPMIGSAPFALVTSATHMPRAIHLFEAAGLHPIAAPTEHLVRFDTTEPARWFSDLPRSDNIHKTERFWYETLGQWWLKLRGK
ncbi:ElyC/SanA/YdcF family protein [Neptunicella marina]|uniref:YdcF family protein n=1 Tax=Neptunicella marina TaxID=2125989 RepID=A0A8J6IXT5_9ALTE|nr:ElyC/SanA/YdcF family protein [Neptunicella marina]MBC3767322.1 YdcF family protein [Neptunicella marina]